MVILKSLYLSVPPSWFCWSRISRSFSIQWMWELDLAELTENPPSLKLLTNISFYTNCLQSVAVVETILVVTVFTIHYALDIFVAH